MAEDSRTPPRTLRIFAPLLVICSIGFVVLTVTTLDLKNKTTWSWFWLFALLPGIVGLANHLVMFRQRSSGSEGNQGNPEEAESQHRPRLSEASAAALMLTGIFLVVAKAAAVEAGGWDGLVYAGYGAYISTLWSMLVRLNVSALTPRFLINSSLNTSIAMVLGFMASRIELFKNVTPALYFFIGFCLGWALKALKKNAMATFGMTQTTPGELSIRLLEGVDDGAVDVLEELGITSIQHLATMHAAEVCGRSQYPRDRVLDWIDQSILAMHTNGRINDFRALGIRCAYSLVTIADYASGKDKGDEPLHRLARKRLDEASKRLGVSQEALQITAECIRRDPSYISLDASYPHRHDPLPCPTSEEKESDSRQAPSPAVPIKPHPTDAGLAVG